METYMDCSRLEISWFSKIVPCTVPLFRFQEPPCATYTMTITILVTSLLSVAVKDILEIAPTVKVTDLLFHLTNDLCFTN